MPQAKRSSSLEVNEDFEYQEKEWRFERAGWIGMALVILLALLGLFGTGLVSEVSTGEQDGFQVTYPRFGRWASPIEINIRIPTDLIREGPVSFWIAREFIGEFQVEDISPQPDSQELQPDRINFTFNIAEPGQPVEVNLNLTPQTTGLLQGRLGLEEGAQVSIAQIIYP
jgi:hypothetical protein